MSIIEKIPGIHFLNSSMNGRMNSIEFSQKQILENLFRLSENQKNFFLGGAQDNIWLEHVNQFRMLLQPKDIVNDCQYIRIGNQQGEGGYVMINDFDNVKNTYSLGIGNNVSFDKDIASKGIDVWMYDHTIDKLPEYNDRFHYFRKGISGKKEESLDTLTNYICENGHNEDKNMILKMDIEGYEWELLKTIESNVLAQFSQIVCELHWFTNLKLYPDIISGLKKLNENHQAVHIHANNGFVPLYINGYIFPEVIEVTYIRKEHKMFQDCTRSFPTSLDKKSVGAFPEINFDSWNYNK